MKNLITIIALFITTFVSAQSKLDSLVLVKVNEYRISLGLNKVEFDTVCYLAADNQASYLFKNDSVLSHKQKNIGFETIGKRYVYFGGNERASIAEVSNSVNMNLKADDVDYLDKLANLILDAWKKSVDHNKILTTEKYKFAGVSTKVKSNITGVKNWTHYDVKSTMVFTTNTTNYHP
jgi:uncharacterized protein YkwD